VVFFFLYFRFCWVFVYDTQIWSEFFLLRTKFFIGRNLLLKIRWEKIVLFKKNTELWSHKLKKMKPKRRKNSGHKKIKKVWIEVILMSVYVQSHIPRLFLCVSLWKQMFSKKKKHFKVQRRTCKKVCILFKTFIFVKNSFLIPLDKRSIKKISLLFCSSCCVVHGSE